MIRAANAKEVLVENQAEETYHRPNQNSSFSIFRRRSSILESKDDRHNQHPTRVTISAACKSQNGVGSFPITIVAQTRNIPERKIATIDPTSVISTSATMFSSLFNRRVRLLINYWANSGFLRNLRMTASQTSPPFYSKFAGVSVWAASVISKFLEPEGLTAD